MAKRTFGSLAEAKAALREGKIEMEEFMAMVDTFVDSDSPGKVKISKTQCPVSREYFNEIAEDLDGEEGVSIGGVVIPATVKHFSSGSFGWNINGKATVILVDKKRQRKVKLPCQISGNAIVVNSKDANEKGLPKWAEGAEEDETEVEGVAGTPTASEAGEREVA